MNYREEITYKGYTFVRVGNSVSVKDKGNKISITLPKNVEDWKEYVVTSLKPKVKTSGLDLLTQRKQIDDYWVFVTYLHDGDIIRYGAGVHEILDIARQQSQSNLQTQQLCDCQFGNGYGYVTRKSLELSDNLTMMDYVQSRMDGNLITKRV